MKEWIEHEKRVSELVSILKNSDSDFQVLHTQDPTIWVDLGKFFLAYSTSENMLRKEFEMCLPMIKDKFQSRREEILYKLEYERTNLKDILRIGAKKPHILWAWVGFHRAWRMKMTYWSI